MRFCTLATQKVLPRSFCRTAVRSVGSTASAAPTSPPPMSPSAANPADFARTPEELRLENHSYEESIYKYGKHRSNALDLVHKVPIIEVEGDMAICDGGGGALGHPLEYISLKRPGAVEYCKYCSLRYTQKKK